MRRLVIATLLALGLGTSGCGDGLLGDGKVCVSSLECAPGLLCDFGKTPHVCAPSDTVNRDLSVRIRDMSAVEDLTGSD
jgi:hypothetical protein